MKPYNPYFFPRILWLSTTIVSSELQPEAGEDVGQAYVHFAHALKLETNNSSALKGRQVRETSLSRPLRQWIQMELNIRIYIER